MQSGEERVCQRPKNRALAQPDGAGTCPCCAGENPVCDARALAESCCSEPPRLSGASGQRRGGNLSRQAARLSRHILSRCAPCGIPRPRNPACHASLQPHRNPARSPSGRAFQPQSEAAPNSRFFFNTNRRGRHGNTNDHRHKHHDTHARALPSHTRRTLQTAGCDGEIRITED